MARPSLREKLLESGVDTVHRRGFGGSGVREITSAAGVPQGCFTNHFRSKEDFGVAVVDRYCERLRDLLDRTLLDDAKCPIERLDAYFDAVTSKLSDKGWQQGCLISNLALEIADHSEPIRIRLSAVLAELQQAFASVLKLGQLGGDVRSDVDAQDLADVLLAAWHGAMLRMKVDRSSAPLDRFRRTFVATLARPTPATTKAG